MSKPGDRIWTVDLWRLQPLPGADPERVAARDAGVFEWVPVPNALTDALFELDGLMRRVGGVVQMASRRYEIAEGRVETIQMVFRWRSFVPLEKGGADQAAPPSEQDGTPAQAEAPPPASAPELPDEDEALPPFKEAPGAGDGPVTHESVTPAS